MTSRDLALLEWFACVQNKTLNVCNPCKSSGKTFLGGINSSPEKLLILTQGPRSRGGRGACAPPIFCPPLPPQYWVTNGAGPQSQSCSVAPVTYEQLCSCKVSRKLVCYQPQNTRRKSLFLAFWKNPFWINGQHLKFGFPRTLANQHTMHHAF